MPRTFEDEITSAGKLWETSRGFLEALSTACGEDVDRATAIAAAFRGDDEFRTQVVESMVDIFTRQRWPMLSKVFDILLEEGDSIAILEAALRSDGWNIDFQMTHWDRLTKPPRLIPMRHRPEGWGLYKVIRIPCMLTREQLFERYSHATYPRAMSFCHINWGEVGQQLGTSRLIALGTDQGFKETPPGMGYCAAFDRRKRVRAVHDLQFPPGTFFLVKNSD